MSLNYAFSFSVFLLALVVLNIYFFYTLNTIDRKSPKFNVPNLRINITASVFRDIFEYLNYLPNQYKSRNSKFSIVQKKLINSFNTTRLINPASIWLEAENVSIMYLLNIF